MSLNNTARGAIVATTLAAAVVGGAVVTPSLAHAAETMRCEANVDSFGYIGERVLASGSATAIPGTVAGGSIAVLSQRVKEVYVDVAIHRFSGGETVVASAGSSEDGPSTYFNAHENTSTSAGVRYDGAEVAYQVAYRVVVTAECRSTGGWWLQDSVRSDTKGFNIF